MLRLKLDDLGVILEAYEALLEGRFQDGESEFRCAVERAGQADFLKNAAVYFFGFDLTPPTLHQLIAAIGAVCPETSVFLPLENDPEARDFDAFLPLQACCDRLIKAAIKAGAAPELLLAAMRAREKRWQSHTKRSPRWKATRRSSAKPTKSG